MNVLRLLIFALALLVFPASPTAAQRSAGAMANIDPTFLIDMPVAGILPATSGAIDTWLYPDGGMLVSASYGLITNLNVGLSFGGTNLIGSGTIIWNRMPEIMVRYRVLEESRIYPAIVLGFDTQGKDGYLRSQKQYVVKSPGFFMSVSKNYSFLGTVSFHGGLNYTLERYDDDTEPNLWVGLEKSIGPLVSGLFEYNFAFDNDKDRKGFWNGSLNLGVRFPTNIGFNADILFKNLLHSEFYYPQVVREIRIQYIRYL